MLFENKSTFKDFVEGPESFATNILSSRLRMLEEYGIIEKSKHSTNKKTNIYTLTQKGVSLAPVLLELTLWSKYNIQEFNPDLNLDKDLDKVEKDKEKAFQVVAVNYEQFKNAVLNAM
jgi:DNA-binding HxlR family transcriptional regulator